MHCAILFGLAFLQLATFSYAFSGYGESHKQKILRMAYEVETNSAMKEKWRQEMVDGPVLPDVRFECNVAQSPFPPTSVHRLRPSDINIIAAFGDSITAGNGLGASTAPQVIMENRGESFSVGGDNTLDHGVVTLANILKKFNPDILGFSSCPSGRENVKRSGLNVAQPGAVNYDIPEQARMVIDRIKENPVYDFFGHWKVITLFIGGNDLCYSCDDWDLYSPEAYEAKIREAVDILYNELPRVYLNLQVIFDVTPLGNFSQSGVCDTLQTRFCDCAINDTSLQDLRNTQLGYFDAMQNIANDAKYTYREDFAVVLQPHLRDFVMPTDPETGEYIPGFLAPDCFHPSRLGHQFFAFALWDMMLTPVGRKPMTTYVNLGPDPNVLSCPTTTSPYFFTNLNSNQ